MSLNPLKRSFDTMMAMLKVKELSEDAIMTTDSPSQSFMSTDSGAMDIDNENDPKYSGRDVHRLSSSHLGTQSTQHVNTFIVDQHGSHDSTSTTGQTGSTVERPQAVCARACRSEDHIRLRRRPSIHMSDH
jgi:hypothetical protein